MMDRRAGWAGLASRYSTHLPIASFFSLFDLWILHGSMERWQKREGEWMMAACWLGSSASLRALSRVPLDSQSPLSRSVCTEDDWSLKDALGRVSRRSDVAHSVVATLSASALAIVARLISIAFDTIEPTPVTSSWHLLALWPHRPRRWRG